jgi:hypothetical protein
MGLGGGPNGAKATFKYKFPSAFRDFPNLVQAREAVGVSRSETLAVVDGNVLVMAMPASVDTFPAYVNVLANQINGAVQAAAHVVVVFDEPAAMTKAKAEEQKARDSRRTPQTPVCSDDLVACPKDDNYTKGDLEAEGLNVRLLMNHRPTRGRFHDALCVAVLEHLKTNFVGSDSCWSLTFDGVDERGADRPIGATRKVGILSSHPELWKPVLTRDEPIGEGDLKLTDVTHRVHLQRNTSSPLANVVLNLQWTIDTDSFLIELLQQSRREARADEDDRNELTLLCLREPTRKRRDEPPTPAYFQCIDLSTFHGELVKYMFGTNVSLPDFEERKRLTMALFAACVALCGCDFVTVQGLRCDLIMPCVRDVARNNPEVLKLMHGVFTGKAGDVRNAADAIRAVLDNFIDSLSGLGGHMTKTRNNASKYNDMQVLRACWVVSYWLGYEFKSVHEFGFCHLALDEESVSKKRKEV